MFGTGCFRQPAPLHLFGRDILPRGFIRGRGNEMPTIYTRACNPVPGYIRHALLSLSFRLACHGGTQAVKSEPNQAISNSEKMRLPRTREALGNLASAG